MAIDLNPPPSTNEVRFCVARLRDETPCNKPTKDVRFQYCVPHYKVYQELTEEYTVLSQRNQQMKGQIRIEQGAVKAIQTIADVDTAIRRVQEWRDNIDKEIQKREKHHMQFFAGKVDEGHRKWLEGLQARDRSEAEDILRQLDTRRREILEADPEEARRAMEEAGHSTSGERGDHFARTVPEEAIDSAKTGVPEVVALPGRANLQTGYNELRGSSRGRAPSHRGRAEHWQETRRQVPTAGTYAASPLAAHVVPPTPQPQTAARKHVPESHSTQDRDPSVGLLQNGQKYSSYTTPTVEPYQSRPADIESQRPATPTDEAPERRTVDLRMFGLFVMGTTVVVLESLVLWWVMGRNSHKPKASWL